MHFDVGSRLNGNEKPFFGRVEIFKEKLWGSVCFEDLTEVTTKVVCRELGFPGKIGVIPISQSLKQQRLDNLNCFGDEKMVAECLQGQWVNKSCSSGNVAGLLCQTGKDDNTVLQIYAHVRD